MVKHQNSIPKNQLCILPPNPESLGKDPIVIRNFSLVPNLAKLIEQAGHSYASLQGKFMRQIQRQQVAEGQTTDENGEQIILQESDDEEEQKSPQMDSENQKDYEKKKRNKTKEDIQREALTMDNFYALLGLDDKEFIATDYDIGKAYKQAALHFHPDKIGASLTEEDKQIWLKIQKAYDTLSDPVKRKKHDSTLPFDDEIPDLIKDKVNESNFYEIFGNCFKANSRFSTIKPVPELGDQNSSIEDVKKFYKFWDNFKTWRDFCQYDEYNLDDAQERAEKRWMEKQNKKLREKYDKDERKRIMDLTDRAYNSDPRILAESLLEQDAKNAAKLTKKLNKQKKSREIEDIKKQKEDEKRKIEEAIEAEKNAAKEKQKQLEKLYKESVKKFVELCQSKMPNTKYDKFYCYETAKKYQSQEKIDSLISKLTCIESQTVQDFVDKFLEIVEGRKIVKQEILVEKKEEGPKENTGFILKEWSEEEIALLNTAIEKFPNGTINRWKVISNFVGKSQKEVTAKYKDIQEKIILEELKKQEAEEQLQKQAEREERMRRNQKNGKQIAEANEIELQQKEKITSEISKDGWTIEQKKQMDQGIKEVPTSLPTKERWAKIAEFVNGKDQDECFAKYQESFKNKKKNKK